jgi:hypothetical protein
MIRAILAAALLPGPALALSCEPADPLSAFGSAEAAPDRYVVLLGRLDFDPALMPEGGYVEGATGTAPAPAPVPARFRGEGLAARGFAPSPVEAMTLQPSCAGPWCGSVEPGDWLLFARLTPQGPVVEVGPCGGTVFERPPQAVLDRLAACMRGEACGGPEGPEAP